MQFKNIAAIAALSTAVSAAPAPVSEATVAARQAAVTDADILQYALTLEHLENAFYKQALSRWPLSDFVAANQTAAFYNQLKYIAHDEESHVQYLTAGLTAAGAQPVAACTYNFGMNTAAQFINLASVIEGLGVSAYLGGAPLITSKAYLTAAGSILVTEAIHQSALRNANNQIPMANPYGTPLGLNAVYSMAANFIVSCPSTNAALPVKAYPALTLRSGTPTAAGAPLDLIPATMPTGTYFVTFVSGLQVLSVQGASFQGGIRATVPQGVEGQSYVFITSTNGTATDSNILYGPAIIQATPGAPTFDLSVM